MTTRDIPEAVLARMEAADSPDALLCFLTISHPSLATPLRLVNDVVDYDRDGALFTGLPFEFTPLSEDERAGQGELTVQNISREIGLAIDGLDARPQVAVEICSSADFDLTVEPREELTTPASIYAFAGFEITEVEVTAIEARARIALRDIDGEPWPYIRATEARCPGHFK
ncbi:DUF1833 family protein [Vannielia litorea]|uniref:DUF1833 family protein n=1 Tax=Vannielia litorea TaxID=1217970 RepID=UPI001BCD7F10|nr:DUF1833 family protein [Vannielia litorea]MBS8228404.1 DUF1833 domain-containing protein [Vannielia litorea]